MPGSSFANGRLIGVDGEILQWIADQLHLKIKPAMMEFSAEIGSVQTRRIDVMLGMVSWRPQRAEVMLMSDPLYYPHALFVQKKDHNWDHVADLEGKQVASIQGFGQVQELKKIDRIDLHLYDTSDAALRDLLAGRVQVLFADPALVIYSLKKNPDWDIHALPANQTFDPKYPTLSGGKTEVVFGMSKEAPELAKAINEKIDEAWQSCLLAHTAAKYGLTDAAWFEAGGHDSRAGKDRPADWKPPAPPAGCK
jgi:polar amino acid transport system substrate-binding protein